MSHVYFNTCCSVCGRRLKIHVQNLGVEVQCRHCTACFVACSRTEGDDHRSPLVRRADALLGSAHRRQPRAVRSQTLPFADAKPGDFHRSAQSDGMTIDAFGYGLREQSLEDSPTR